MIIGLGNQLVNDVRKGDVHIERIERSDKTPQELVQKVEKFYLDGKNSRILPGIKDVISVKTKEGRTKWGNIYYCQQFPRLISNLGKKMMTSSKRTCSEN